MKYEIKVGSNTYEASNGDELTDKLDALEGLGHDAVKVGFIDDSALPSAQNTVPSFRVGEIYEDPESNAQFGSGKVELVEYTNISADEYEINIRGKDTTVSAQNPGHPPDANVVRAKYVDGGSKTYAFPETRLEEL